MIDTIHDDEDEEKEEKENEKERERERVESNLCAGPSRIASEVGGEVRVKCSHFRRVIVNHNAYWKCG